MYDYLIVGAGLSGLVMAEQLITRQAARCLILEKRPHIAGNCYDSYDEHGVLVHRYGPHYFRTNSQVVLDYLSAFTTWIPAQYKVLSQVEGRLFDFPINLNTFEQILGRPSSSEEMTATLAAWRTPIEDPKNSEEMILSRVGPRLYQMFYEGYTQKQWQRHPRQLDASVCSRVPIRTDRNDRYLSERFQGMPAKGYTAMCEQLIAACGDALDLVLEDDFFARREAGSLPAHRHLIYTGPLDRYFNYQYGPLPYRSLRFEYQHDPTLGLKECLQPCVQINYPAAELPYTRSVEIKHVTQQSIKGSTLVREYPLPASETNEPYYPVPSPSTRALYEQYKSRASQERHTTFLGRLATYQYLNMDQVVAFALQKAKSLAPL